MAPKRGIEISTVVGDICKTKSKAMLRKWNPDPVSAYKK